MADRHSRRERLLELGKKKLLNCDRCPPNRGDNYKRKDWERKERLAARGVDAYQSRWWRKKKTRAPAKPRRLCDCGAWTKKQCMKDGCKGK